MKEKIVSHADNVEMEEVERANKISIQWLIGEDKDVNYYMRRFTLKPNGKMVQHKHENFEHQEYILKGKIKVTINGEEHQVEEGNFLYIPKGSTHSYENIGDEEAQFLCVIPPIENRHTEITDTTPD